MTFKFVTQFAQICKKNWPSEYFLCVVLCLCHREQKQIHVSYIVVVLTYLTSTLHVQKFKSKCPTLTGAATGMTGRPPDLIKQNVHILKKIEGRRIAKIQKGSNAVSPLIASSSTDLDIIALWVNHTIHARQKQ